MRDTFKYIWIRRGLARLYIFLDGNPIRCCIDMVFFLYKEGMRKKTRIEKRLNRPSSLHELQHEHFTTRRVICVDFVHLL